MLCVVDNVEGMTQLHDVVYVVFVESSRLKEQDKCDDTAPKEITVDSTAILMFNATTRQLLRDIDVTNLKELHDIVACEQTFQLYIAASGGVWRMSANGADIQHWLPRSPDRTFLPQTLSVTSTRLLVTSRYGPLRQFDAVGDELRRVRLPFDMKTYHAMESPTGTFIVSLYNEQLKQGQVAEVSTGGKVLRQFSGSPLSPLLYVDPPHIAVDSHGNIFVADGDNRRILLLDAQLSLRRVIIDEHQLSHAPRPLCYREQSGQLLVVSFTILFCDDVLVFDVLRR